MTVSHVFGEITWLLSQSPRHSDVAVGDLGWRVMPAIPLRQFHIFREGVRPVGVALWGFVSESVEARLAAGPLTRAHPLNEGDWASGGRLWLVELVAPFATAENRHIEVMFGDLLTGPFQGREFRVRSVDPATGTSQIKVVAADAGARLVADIAEQLRSPRQ